MKQRTLFAAAFLILGLAFTAHAKDPVVAVLSLDLAPYQDALDSFEQTYAKKNPVVHLTQPDAHVEGEPQVVVAFGGKAALAPYPEGSYLVYCMAPGTHLRPGDRGGAYTEISMMPAPAKTLSTLLRMQPGLKRLAVLWTSPANEFYLVDLRKAGKQMGVEIQGEKISDANGLPNRLRELEGHTDALWIPSDPLMVSEANLTLISQFAQTTHVPFYSSVNGLTKKGASASISVSFKNIGHSAAQVSLSVLQGKSVGEKVYVEDVDVVVNEDLSKTEKAGSGASKDVIP